MTRIARLWIGFSVVLMSFAACGSATVAPTTPAPVAASPTLTPGPRPTAHNSGPVDAVTEAYETAISTGLIGELGFFACVYGGADANQFSDMFAGISLLALASSGVSPEDFTTAFGTAFDGFQAAETSRSGDSAVVHVSVRVTFAPDIGKLRELMQRGLTTSGSQIDDTVIDAIVLDFVNRTAPARTIEHDVAVTRYGGGWHVCAP